VTRNRFLFLVFVLVAAVVLAACGNSTKAAPGASETPTLVPGSATAVPADYPGPDNAAPPQQAEAALAAQVNGTPITLVDFEQELVREEASRRDIAEQMEGVEVDDLIPPDRAEFEREVLEQMIETVLIEQAAAAAGFTLTEEELDAEVTQSIEDAGGSEAWNEWLTLGHLTPDVYRDQLRTQLLGGMLTAQIVEGIPEVAEQVHARHILIDTQEEAENILVQLNAGADFAVLAGEHSIDATTREAGGDLAWFMRGQLLETAVEDAAFALQPGETSGPVASTLGYHIVQTLERDPARPLSAETRQALIQTAIDQWRQALWADASIIRYVGAGS
jgi:parvulin-like peptidyl-prolyl isomerase